MKKKTLIIFPNCLLQESPSNIHSKCNEHLQLKKSLQRVIWLCFKSQFKAVITEDEWSGVMCQCVLVQVL